jgi:PAS domain S-box-containing protein
MTNPSVPQAGLPDPALMLAAVGEAVIATDAVGRITYWNSVAERLYGWRQDEVLGRDIVEVTPTEQSAADAEALMEAFARGETWTGRFEVQTKDGRRFPARVSNTPMYDESGRFAGVIGVSNDISEQLASVRDQARARQQSAIALLARAALRDITLAQVFDRTVDLVGELLGIPTCAVLLREPSGDRLRVQAGRGLSEGLIGQTLEPRAPDVEPDPLVGTMLLPPDGEVHGREATIPGRHDSYGVLGVYTRQKRAFDDDEYAFLAAAAGVLGSAIARHDVERQLRQSQKLEAAGQLAGGLAHDLNNVLTVIISHAELLRGQATDSGTTAHVAAVLDAAQRAARLSRRLLTFVRPQSQTRVPMAVGSAIDDLQPLLKALLGPRIRLTLEVVDADVRALVDNDELEQLLINLVVNARDSLADGGEVRVRVDVLTSDPATDPQPPSTGQWVRLQVIDNGLGMDEDTSTRAFDPFFTTKPEGAGTGLGLATVGGLATDLGGRAYVHSRVGEGTTATVLLPRLLEGVLARQTKPGHDGNAAIGGAGRARILIVEDQEAVRLVLCELLAQQGYEVHGESDAAGALAHDVRPDLLLTDVQLPGMSGPDLAEALGARWPHLPVVLLSGFAKPTAAAGARFLAKPFREEELLRIIQAALGGGGAHGPRVDGSTGPR